MMFLDGEIAYLDYNIVKLLREILEKYGTMSEENDIKTYSYETKNFKIEKINNKISIYVIFHDGEKWHKIWDNIDNHIVHTDFIDYIKKIPEIEEAKLKEKESNIARIDKIDNDYKVIKKRSDELINIIEAIHYLGDYSDEYLTISQEKVENKEIIGAYITSHIVKTNNDNKVVFCETYDKKRLINVYKPGKWQEHIKRVYEAKKKVDNYYDSFIDSLILPDIEVEQEKQLKKD